MYSVYKRDERHCDTILCIQYNNSIILMILYFIYYHYYSITTSPSAFNGYILLLYFNIKGGAESSDQNFGIPFCMRFIAENLLVVFCLFFFSIRNFLLAPAIIYIYMYILIFFVYTQF